MNLLSQKVSPAPKSLKTPDLSYPIGQRNAYRCTWFSSLGPRSLYLQTNKMGTLRLSGMQGRWIKCTYRIIGKKATTKIYFFKLPAWLYLSFKLLYQKSSYCCILHINVIMGTGRLYHCHLTKWDQSGQAGSCGLLHYPTWIVLKMTVEFHKLSVQYLIPLCL